MSSSYVADPAMSTKWHYILGMSLTDVRLVQVSDSVPVTKGSDPFVTGSDSDTQAASGQLAMVEARGLVEIPQQGRPLDPESPVAGLSANRLERRPPGVPPRRHAARNRLDHDHLMAGFRRGDQPFEREVAGAAVQLVDDEGGQDQHAGGLLALHHDS